MRLEGGSGLHFSQGLGLDALTYAGCEGAFGGNGRSAEGGDMVLTAVFGWG